MKLFLTKEIAEFIKQHKNKEYINISLDLGRSENVYKISELMRLPLDKIKGNWVYMYDDKTKELVKVAIFSDHLYRLRMLRGFPILEIDGLRMHLVKSFKHPLDYARAVCKKLGIKASDVVLDCCTGLGYTAIEASKRAKKVITIEKHSEVLEIAKVNPWSKELFSDNIEIINDEAERVIREIDDHSVNKIIHDPPRYTLAPNLYSRAFYEELLRIIDDNGILYHYTGSFGKGRRDIMKEVANRLEGVGWRIVEINRRMQGIFARPSTKPNNS